jgi:hypothetical protein
MIMNDKIENTVQRTRQYWFIDGLAELSVGGLFILLGIYFFIQAILPPGSLTLIIFQLGFVFLLFGMISISRYLVNKYKSKITFPRTGYVSYKKASKKQRLLRASLGIMIAAIPTILFFTTPPSFNWIPVFTGLLVGGIWLISAIRIGLLRLYLQAILSLILGLYISLANLNTYPSLAIYYSGMGIVLTASGGVVLSKYLRQHPVVENDSPA